MSNILRSYRRGLARHRMENKGFHQINKHGRNRGNKSYFANNWREQLNIYKTPVVE